MALSEGILQGASDRQQLANLLSNFNVAAPAFSAESQRLWQLSSRRSSK
jgi:hypothetical protein